MDKQKDAVMPFTIAGSQVDTFHSQTNGDYQIMIYQPNQTTPKGGWPVIYLLDGKSFFSSAVAITQNQSCPKCLLQEGIIVAIDYPQTSRRELDYLPKPDEFVPEVLPNGKMNIPAQYGGADAFLAFIRDELKPNIEQRFTVNKDKQTLFGHSYGGLFALHTLFSAPEMFNNYIIVSPSIWFSDRYILKESQQFIDNKAGLSHLTQPIHLIMSVGGLEQSLKGHEVFTSEQEKAQRLQHFQNRRVIDNARDLVTSLQQAELPNFFSQFTIYEGQIHQTTPLIALQDGLQIIFKKRLN